MPAAAAADAIDALVQAEMERQRIPGLVLAVVGEGRPPRISAYGLANVEHGVAVRPETVFQSGSVGKQLTAAVVQLLAADGKLSLDDTLERWFEDAPPAWRSITVRHLLTHTSGIPEYEFEGPSGLDLRRDYGEDEMVRHAMGLAPDFAPGTRWNYSNTGYVVLGALIRRVTGRFHGEVLAERVFAPLGMATARVISEDDIVPNRAAGYRLVKGELKNQEWVSPAFNSTADGALYLTVGDLVRWDAALRDGSLLTPAQIAEATRPVALAGGDEYPYGYAWFIAEQRGRPRIEHSGSWQGFQAHIARYVEDGLSVIMLANLAQARLPRIVEGVAGLAVPALALPDPARPATAAEEALAAAALDAFHAWAEGRPSPAMHEAFARARDDSPRSRYFRGLAARRLAARESFHFLGADDVRGRGIRRHGAEVARIAYFGLVDGEGAELVKFYLDGAGRVTGLSFADS